MKKIAIGVLTMVSLMAAQARQPSYEQVEQYLSVMKAREAVEAQVEGFSKQYTTYITDAIPAGGRAVFQGGCGCKDWPPAQHDSFQAVVVSTY